MTEQINYNLIDGEPVANRDCCYHHTERCTLISTGGTYLTPCIPSSHSSCIPGIRHQRDRFKKTLEDFAEGDCLCLRRQLPGIWGKPRALYVLHCPLCARGGVKIWLNQNILDALEKTTTHGKRG
jgi:hypothetical protein